MGSFDCVGTVLNQRREQACPGADELYTVFMDNTLTGRSATDTSTLFVNVCECFFMDFNGSVVCQPGGVFDVTGSFEYAYSPTTGTIEIEATSGTGTYTSIEEIH